MNSLILAIETSCDDTSVAIMHGKEVVSHIVNSQRIHEGYGGIVPQLASQGHQKKIVPTVREALKDARMNVSQVTHVAFTQGPGLIGSLVVGASFAKALSYALEVPLIAVHHMKAHVLANFIEPPYPSFPFVALIVSGGHTQLILVKDYLDMQLLGETRDDAMGEALDKIGKMMGLPYPGGVAIDRYSKEGDVDAFSFPITKVPGFDFSFSGIKTAFLYFLQKKKAHDADFVATYGNDLCASIQASLVSMVATKVEQAVCYTGVKQVVLGGGVAANSRLRKDLYELGKKNNFTVFVPSRRYCTDNAAMIAMTAYYQLQAGDFASYDVASLARMPF